MKTAARNGKHDRSIVLGKRNVLRFDLKESREVFCRRGRGRSFYVDGPKTQKARELTMESSARNLEVESIRSRAESTGGCVNLKIVADIRCTLLLLSTLLTPCGEFGSFNYSRCKIMATQHRMFLCDRTVVDASD